MDESKKIEQKTGIEDTLFCVCGTVERGGYR